MDLEKHWLATVGLIASSLLAICSNLLLLLVFCRRRGLRTISNRFVINLLLINLLSSFLLIPLLIINIEAGKQGPFLENFNITTSEIVEKISSTQPIPREEVILRKEITQVVNGTFIERKQVLIDNRSKDQDDLEIIESNFSLNLTGATTDLSVCTASQFTINFLSTCSILSILLIGLDQYFAVVYPLRCHTYINKTKSVLFILLTWFVSGVFGCLTATTQTNAYYFRNVCEEPPYIRNNFIYALSYVFVIILLPFISICLMYVAIYRAAHRNSSRIRKRTKIKIGTQSSIPKVHSAPNFIEMNEEMQEFTKLNPPKLTSIKRTHSERSNIITSIRTKFSNATVFRYREESRTAKISILVIVMVLVCYLPYGTVFILNSLDSNHPFITMFSLILLISSNLMSPFLFAYRNRRVQRELKRFLTKPFVKEEMRSKPKIVINHIETDLNKSIECLEVVEPFITPEEKLEDEKKSILKRVCSANWSNYKKCSFINVPDGCLDARGSFSSASTQISTED